MLLLTVPCALLGSGCSTAGYYAQAIGGHLELMRARQSIDELLRDDATDPTLREQLQTLVDARRFAVAELDLPDNDSYSSYAATGRRYVTWNVVAADEFSVQARTWCFPVAGCVNYRGYFDERDAERYAAELAAEGRIDVIVGGASAYSTLGWFDDPVLDTMLRGGDIGYVGTLFHELAHQQLYVKDDSNFNEAFASFVEQEAVRQWLETRDEPQRVDSYNAWLARREQFGDLLKTTRGELQALYAQSLPTTDKRAAKQAVFHDLRTRYDELKASWDGYSGYDGWFERDINNARLVSVATYRRYIPAFVVMFDEAMREWPAFYTLAREVSELPARERKQRMQRYLGAAREASADGGA